MRIVLVTDAWEPQINGVVTTVKHVYKELCDEGHDVLLIHPKGRLGIPIPFSGGVRISFTSKEEITLFNPDHVHIFTEGSLGLSARRACSSAGLSFTTGYHTKFPQILYQWFKIPQSLTTKYLKWFHGPSKAILVPTQSMKDELTSCSFAPPSRIKIWGRGVDAETFRPPLWAHHARHVYGKKLICVSRVTAEKGLDDFCKLSQFGYDCTLVGGGPELSRLRWSYPKVKFSGPMPHGDIPKAFRTHSLFVFPSKNDTFGLVMLEANACGLPVVAYPVTGPKDWVQNGKNGFLAKGEDVEDLFLGVAIAFAECSPKGALDKAGEYSWKKSAQEFLGLLHACR